MTFPAIRLRRTRASAWSRALHRETVLTPADLIWPLFVTQGSGVEDPIASLPGVSRWSVDLVVRRAKEAIDLGIPCLALFPNTQAERRSDDGNEEIGCSTLVPSVTKSGQIRSAGVSWTSRYSARLQAEARVRRRRVAGNWPVMGLL